MSKYHYLIVGAGLFGSVFAQQAAERGKRCLVIERRNHVAGILHCDLIEDIQVHRYGPHIFHTNDREVWEYVNRFARFNNFVYSPVAACKDGVYHFPLNMNTFSRIWGTRIPSEAQKMLHRHIAAANIGTPRNLEESFLKLVGTELYQKFIKGYTEKIFGKKCSELPPDLGNISIHFSYDNRFYNEPYQGIPIEGYDVMIKRMLAGCELMLNTEFAGFGRANAGIADKTIFTGMIDEFFTFKRGTLEYRTIKHITEVLDIPNYQGTAIVEYPDADVPYTRTIEHKHFQLGSHQPKTVVTTEYPAKWNTTMEPYFPINDEKNQRLYNSYCALAVAQPDMTFCGRLGTYRYYNMAETVRSALDLAARMLD